MSQLNPIFSALILTFLSHSLSLDLDKLEEFGIQGDFYVSDIAVYFNRAFLALPRTVCENNITSPTLVEVPWKDFNTILKMRINRPIEGQIWAKCEDLQNAVSLAKEGVKSKLWILDKGNKFCPAKVMAYNMLQNMFLVEETIELGGVSRVGLSTIVIENGTKFGNHRAFIANAGPSTIMVCYLTDLVCSHLTLEPSNLFIPIQVDFLALPSVSTGSKMYLTGLRSTHVFSLDLINIPEEPPLKNLTIKLTLLGETLGPSSGLNVDLKDGLVYYLTRDYAVVRWTIGKPFQAEYHDVVAQSFKRLPYVSRLFEDSQGSVYALVNPFNASDCEKETDTKSGNATTYEGRLERVVKVLKYNRLIDVFF